MEAVAGGRPLRRAGGGTAADDWVGAAAGSQGWMCLITSICFCAAKYSTASPKRPAWQTRVLRNRILLGSHIHQVQPDHLDHLTQGACRKGLGHDGGFHSSPTLVANWESIAVSSGSDLGNTATPKGGSAAKYSSPEDISSPSNHPPSLCQADLTALSFEALTLGEL